MCYSDITCQALTIVLKYHLLPNLMGCWSDRSRRANEEEEILKQQKTLITKLKWSNVSPGSITVDYIQHSFNDLDIATAFKPPVGSSNFSPKLHLT